MSLLNCPVIDCVDLICGPKGDYLEVTQHRDYTWIAGGIVLIFVAQKLSLCRLRRDLKLLLTLDKILE